MEGEAICSSDEYVHWEMDPFASYMLVKRSCSDGCSHAHLTDSSCQHKMEWGLTTHKSLLLGV